MVPPWALPTLGKALHLSGLSSCRRGGAQDAPPPAWGRWMGSVNCEVLHGGGVAVELC